MWNDMEELFYFSVRLGCAVYILYKVWQQKKNLRELCDLLYTPPAKNPEILPPESVEDADVIGRTRFVYLDENAGKTVAPYMCQPLEKDTDYIGEEEAVPEEDVECNLPLEEMERLREEQEELDKQAIPSEPATPAITPEDLANVGDVLFNIGGAGKDIAKSRRAAVTLRAIRETDMFDVISSQVENDGVLEELMGMYLDEEGNALPAKKEKNGYKAVADWRSLV